MNATGTAPRPLTPRQAQIVALLCKAWPNVPTFRELMAALGIRSTNGISDHLHYIEQKGYISCGSFQRRAITVLRWPNGEPFEPSQRGPKGRWPERLYTSSGVALRLVAVLEREGDGA